MNKQWKRLAVAGAVLAVFATGSHAAGGPNAAAQPGATPSQAQSPSQSRNAIDIVTWDHNTLRQGYSAQKLLDMDVKGTNGEKIGDVKDILVDTSGKVSALVVSHGGVLGIGDKELRVPFNEFKPDAKLENLVVSISKDNVEKYRVRDDDRQARSGEMKLSELMDDQVALRGGQRYGDVEDMILSRDGRIKAIVVEGEGRGNRYAFPWTNGAYDRTASRFSYDYDRDQISRLRPFDYAALGIAGPEDRGTAAGSTPGRTGAGTTGGDTGKR